MTANDKFYAEADKLFEDEPSRRKLHKILDMGMQELLPTLLFLEPTGDPFDEVVFCFGRHGIQPILDSFILYKDAAAWLCEKPSAYEACKPALVALTLRLDVILTHVKDFRMDFASFVWDPADFRPLQRILSDVASGARVIKVCTTFTLHDPFANASM